MSVLSERRRRSRERFEDLFMICRKRGICCCQLKTSTTFEYTGLSPNSRNYQKLKRILRHDDVVRNPYLTWSKQDLGAALAARRIPVSDAENTRLAYRRALEVADDARRFPFLLLPKDIRLIVYEYAFSIEKAHLSRSPLLSSCRKVREEGSPIFFRNKRFRLGLAFDVHQRRTTTLPEFDHRTKRWLSVIGAEHVKKIRHIILEHSGNEYHIDLSDRNADNWCFSDMSKHSDTLCRQKEPMTLRASLLKAQQTTPTDLLLRAPWLKWSPEGLEFFLRRSVELSRTACENAQEGMDLFAETCGRGKSVETTVDGLEVVVGGFVAMGEAYRRSCVGYAA